MNSVLGKLDNDKFANLANKVEIGWVLVRLNVAHDTMSCHVFSADIEDFLEDIVSFDLVCQVDRVLKLANQVYQVLIFVSQVHQV